MNRRHIATAVAAVALLTCTGGAHAGSAQATFSNFRIQLVDLDPGDGIAPSVVFQDLQGGTFVAAESGAPMDFLTDIHAGGNVFGPASSTSAHGSASAFATLTGDPYGSGGVVTSGSTADAPGTYGASTVQLGDGGMVVSFTLSPETRLVISGDAAVAATATVDDLYTDAWASIFLKLADYTGQGDVSQDGVQVEQFGTKGGSQSASTDSRHIEISFDNAASASADGIFFGSIDTSISNVAPSTIPEPGGLSLMVAGLAMVASGSMLRDRRLLPKGRR